MAQSKAFAPFVTRSKKRQPDESRKPRSEIFGILPEADTDKKSLTLERFQFRRDGVGWECKEDTYPEDPATRTRKRKRVYVGHLSRTNYERMKKESRTNEALTIALVEWAKAKKAGKATA